ncbi:ATP-dependent DNA helicase PIF1 [Leucoagaricus sp. SymC.cos]|nr:ATP-dependent DNA helicase PIF1 [Leucoagaricus sp. SymC.cos]
MLNEMRYGKMQESTIQIFKSLSRTVTYSDGIEPTEMYPTRREVANANAWRLKQLPGSLQTYEAQDHKGVDHKNQPISYEQMLSLLDRLVAPKTLELKVGAQVMLVKNLKQGILVNGSIGRVVRFDTPSEAAKHNTKIAPNPVSPYYLQVYTSAYLVPIIISVGNVLQYDWTVPFAPGTLYQICMFDKNGNTGGCQDVYTMIPSNSSSSPSCTNVTFPNPLQVDATVANGPMSQYGWIEQCTDISIVPRNGTPPYLMTVSPTLHPPYNITGDGSKSLNWTVSLSWASSFFVSVVDSAGNVWSNGLLHSGEGPNTACLAGLIRDNNSSGVSTGTAVGAGLGGLGVGLIAGLAGAIFFLHFRDKKRNSATSLLDLRGGSFPGSPQGIMENTLGLSTNTTSFGNRTSNLPTAGTHYHVEPFVLPPVNEDGRLGSPPTSPTHNPSNPSLNAISSAPDTSARPTSSGRQVYVVHHDGGRAPVTVYTQEGTQVVELPPGYPGEAMARGSAGPLLNPHSHVGHDARSAVGSSTGIGSGSSDAERTDASGPAEQLASLQQVRRPGNIRKPKVRRPESRD